MRSRVKTNSTIRRGSRSRKKSERRSRSVTSAPKEIDEADRNFNNALEKGYNAEKEQNYSDMAEYFSIALNLRPDDEEAKRKYDDALRKKAELTVIQNKYKEKYKKLRMLSMLKIGKMLNKRAKKLLVLCQNQLKQNA